jgi:hypothetical protein
MKQGYILEYMIFKSDTLSIISILMLRKMFSDYRYGCSIVYVMAGVKDSRIKMTSKHFQTAAFKPVYSQLKKNIHMHIHTYAYIYTYTHIHTHYSYTNTRTYTLTTHIYTHFHIYTQTHPKKTF